MPLAHDRPIQSQADDLLGRWPFARHVADHLAELEGGASVVVGLYGKWGEGKTSVLNMVRNALREHRGVVTVNFNPWLYEGHVQLLLAFFETIAAALQRNLRKGKQVAAALRKASRALGSLSVGVGPLGVAPGKALESLAEQLDSVELAKMRKSVEKILAEQHKRVVVLIDDIDRLDVDEVAMVFKLVKLAADFDHTAYVLAMDDIAVAEALKKRYVSEELAGASFVEKIVQVPLRLPRVAPALLLRLVLQDLQQLLEDHDVEMSDAEVSRFSVTFQRHIAPQLATPRSSKRFMNGVRFSTRALRGEVNFVDLILLEGMRSILPELYEAVRNNRDAALGHGIGGFGARDDFAKQMIRTRFDPVLSQLLDDEKTSAIELLGELFPKTKSVYANNMFGDESYRQWRSQRRACADEYFDRYFAYAVPPGDLSTSDLDEFLKVVASGSEQDAVEALRRLVSFAEDARVVGTLREREAHLPSELAERLLAVLAQVGGELRDVEGVFGLASGAFQQGAMLSAVLIGRLEQPSRLDAAVEFAQSAADLGFAAEFFRWIRVGSSDEAEPRILTDEEVDDVGRTLAQRISRDAEAQALFESFRNRAPYLLWIWSHWGSRDDAISNVNTWLDEDSERALEIARAFSSRAWNLETGAQLPLSLTRDALDAMRSHEIDVEAMESLLRQRYGDVEADRNYDLEPSEDEDERLARQFLQQLSRRDAEETDPQRPPEVTED
jgi:hypothetical protein